MHTESTRTIRDWQTNYDKSLHTTRVFAPEWWVNQTDSDWPIILNKLIMHAFVSVSISMRFELANQIKSFKLCTCMSTDDNYNAVAAVNGVFFYMYRLFPNRFTEFPIFIYLFIFIFFFHKRADWWTATKLSHKCRCVFATNLNHSMWTMKSK